MNNDYLFAVSFLGFVVSVFLLVARVPPLLWLVGLFLIIVFVPLFFYSICLFYRKP